MAKASHGTSSLSCEAPRWAKLLADQAIRDRDVVPVETWPDTPRSEEGEKEELLERMREAEMVVRAAELKLIGKRQWIRWGEYFDGIPGVGEYFRQLLRELPERHGPQKATRKRVELATAIQEGIPCMSGGLRLLAFAQWRWENYYDRFLPAWSVCTGVPGGACVFPQCGCR